MPIYEYVCDEGHVTAARKKLVQRNDPVPCQECDLDARRAFNTSPHMGAIPGIPNRLNKDWDETGQVIYDPKRPEYMPKYRNPS